VVLANNVMIAGHVAIGDHAFFGGGVGVHQFCRVGESAMVAGLARIALDLPPFVLAAERNEIAGLNLVGLKRRGFARDVLAELKACYRAVYLAGAGNPRAAAMACLSRGVRSGPARQFLEFFAESKRGVARARTAAAGEGENDGG
jgi:UDP-N-acetylglucosamine acyltransferase